LENEPLPFFRFAVIPIVLTYLVKVSLLFLGGAFIPSLMLFWAILFSFNNFFQLGTLYLIGNHFKFLKLKPKNTIYIILGISVFLNFLYSMLILGYMDMLVKSKNIYQISVINDDLDIFKGFFLIINYLGFMLLFQLDKSSLKNIGELTEEKSSETKNELGDYTPNQTDDISPQKIIQSFDNLHDLHEHQVLTDEEYISKKNEQIENLRNIEFSLKPENFLAELIPLLKNGKITKTEMKKIKEIILNKTKKNAA
jgi:hypothetical protein